MADLFRVQHRECQCDKGPRVPIFEWYPEVEDGIEPDAITYDMPAGPEAHVGLDYIEINQSQGLDAATRWIIVTMLGQDAWNALRSPGVDSELFYGVLGEVRRRVFGSSNRGPKA